MAPMEAAARTRLVALAVLVAVLLPLVLIALPRDGDDARARPGGLRVERTPGLAELTIYVEDSGLNEPATAGGATEVTLECVDADENVVHTAGEAWPFADTDDGTLDPHVHVGMEEEMIERIVRCSLTGTDPPLEGRKL